MKRDIKKRVFSFALLITLLVTLCFSGCDGNASHAESETTSKGESQVLVLKKSAELYDIAAGDKVYKDLQILCSCEGSSGNSGRIKSAAIYGPDHVYPYIPLLIVMSNDTPLLFELEECNALYPIAYMQDIDGDGEDEIIVDSLQAASHFVRSVLFVLKVVEDKLEVLYRFPARSYKEEEKFPLEMNNFGFTSQLMENYQLLIEYPPTKFSKVLDVSHLLSSYHLYDDNGIFLPDVETIDVVNFDSVLVSGLQDVDGDGACEIILIQAAHFLGKDLGSVLVTLGYNSQEKTMEVMSVDFELRGTLSP